MLLYLYGPDAYRRQRSLREGIIVPFKKKHPQGVVRFFDASEDEDLQELMSFSGVGLFAQASLAVVTQPSDGGKALIAFLKEKKDEPALTVVVVAEKKLNKDFSFLGAGIAFDELEGQDFLAFLKAESKAQGMAVTDAQIKAVGALFMGDTWGAVTELQRVAFGGTLAEQGVPFDFVSSMSALTNKQGATPQRLRALALLLAYDDDPMKTFHMAGGWGKGSDKVVLADYDVLVKMGRLEAPEALCGYVLGLSAPTFSLS